MIKPLFTNLTKEKAKELEKAFIKADIAIMIGQKILQEERKT